MKRVTKVSDVTKGSKVVLVGSNPCTGTVEEYPYKCMDRSGILEKSLLPVKVTSGKRYGVTIHVPMTNLLVEG